MKRICTICARGGSKGVKGKNLRPINGIPLIAHSILQAKDSGLFDVIAVSSDSEEILNTAKEYGAHFTIKRPEHMATDTAAKLPVIQHCASEAMKLSGIDFDTFVDLDCTSPLRIPEDIKGAVFLFEEGHTHNVITGMPSRRSPYFNLVESTENGFIKLSKKLDKPIVRRQDAPQCFDMNASIYVWNKDSLFNSSTVITDQTKIFVMPEERSIDIDSELDFEFVKFMMEKNV